MSAVEDPFAIRGQSVQPVEAVPEVEYDYDLDAVIAEREAVKPFTFKFGGESFTLPPRPDMVAATDLSAGRLDEGFKRLFGESQWERIHASEAVLDDVALTALFERYQAHTGMDLGESKASQNSSRNTAKR